MQEKEIGKLLEYINKYGKTSNCGPFETCRIEPATNYNSSYLVLSWDDNGEGDWKSWHLEVPRLISKEYGFIKWLIEQDKIDYDKAKVHHLWKERYSNYESILMKLSISEQPIDLLISILK